MSTVIQRSLAGGELAPQLWPRTDTSKYTSALRSQRNGITMRSGGVTVRPGTTIVSPIKDSTKTARLIEFVFNLAQTYVLEFGDLYIRFHQNGAPVLVSGVAAYNAGTAYNIGDLVVSGGVNYYCIQAGTAHTPVSSPTYWYPLTGNIYEIPSPYAYTDLPAIRFAQTGDLVTLTHPSYPQQELSRLGQTQWTLATVLFGSKTAAPTGATAVGSGGTSNVTYILTSVDATTGEESTFESPYAPPVVTGGGTFHPQATLVVANNCPNAGPSTTNPVNLNWTANPSAAYYNIYRSTNYLNAAYGFIGTTATTGFTDDGIKPDLTNTVLEGSTNPFNGSGAYPTACAYYQQRIYYGNSVNSPSQVRASGIGLYHNFDVHTPTIASDALAFAMAGTRDTVQHLLSLNTLLVFTSGSEVAVEGDQAGAITPAAVNPKTQSVHGSSQLRPLVVGEYAVYVQARGSVVRDLGFNFQVDGYRGDDLTAFATHLFDGYTLVDWAFQLIPHSVIWAVRNDGVLLGMTYVREQQILAWHRHDFDGTVENVCVVPEGSYDAVYLIVKRTINGSTVRYIERMSAHYQPTSDIVDYIGMDVANTYDGRNTSVDTMTLSGGTLWDETETLTLTASAAHFVSSDPTNLNQIVLTGADGSVVRFSIKTYVSTTVVTGLADRAVPASLRSTATAVWSKAITHISGLSYLEGKKVSVFADGFVVASPNNAAYPVLTVTSGAIVLPEAYSVIHVGLPFICDLETLDIDSPSLSDTMSDKFKFIGNVTLFLQNSRGIWIGGSNPDTNLNNLTADPLMNLVELKLRQDEGYSSPDSLITGKVSQTIMGNWDQNGHVFIRQVDPLPMTVAAIAPDGQFPLRSQ